jgi:hypothetical protein
VIGIGLCLLHVPGRAFLPASCTILEFTACVGLRCMGDYVSDAERAAVGFLLFIAALAPRQPLQPTPGVSLTLHVLCTPARHRRYLDRLGEDKYLMALKNLCDAGERPAKRRSPSVAPPPRGGR